MNKKLGALALLGASAVVLAGCSGGGTAALSESAAAGFDPDGAKGQNITLWLMGGDTPDELREYLKTEYKDATGGTLTIEEQSWGDALTKLSAQLPDANNTPTSPRSATPGRRRSRPPAPSAT